MTNVVLPAKQIVVDPRRVRTRGVKGAFGKLGAHVRECTERGLLACSGYWRTGRPQAANTGITEPYGTRENPRTLLRGAGVVVATEELGDYRSDAVNFAHASAVNASVPPSRLVVSRTRTTPGALPVSTQLAPPLPL